MTIKQRLSLFLAVIIVTMFSVPVFATTVLLQEDTYENVENSSDIATPDNTPNVQPPTLPDTSDTVTDDTETDLPQSPPEFYTQMIRSGNGYILQGFFTGYTPEMKDIQPYYSLDGVQYTPILCDPLDTSASDNFPRGTILNEKTSPFKEYLAKEFDTFYIRLHYTTNNGEIISHSQVAQTTRPTQAQPLPDDMTILTRYPTTMRASAGRLPIYQYNITVRAGASRSEILELLPQTLPVEIQLLDSDKHLLVQTLTDYQVEWNLPDTIIYENTQITNAIKVIVPPASFQIETLYDLYFTQTLQPPPMPLSLSINVVDSNAKAKFHLYAVEANNVSISSLPLYMTLPLKPTGAQSIIPSYSLDGGQTWIATQDILPYSEDINAYPKNSDYRNIPIFNTSQSPYKEYLAGEIDGFSVRLDITGGIFDGQSDITVYPLSYEYEPPNNENGSNGSSGNENNAGSDIGNGHGDSSSNGGLHPGISDKDKPPVEVLPELPIEEEAESPSPDDDFEESQPIDNTGVSKIPELPPKKESTKQATQTEQKNIPSKSDIDNNPTTVDLPSIGSQEVVAIKPKKNNPVAQEIKPQTVISSAEKEPFVVPEEESISNTANTISMPKEATSTGLPTVVVVAILIVGVAVVVLTNIKIIRAKNK